MISRLTYEVGSVKLDLKFLKEVIMPIVTILAVEGRTIEQKRGLAKDITEAVMKNFKVSAEQVEVIIQEMKRENFAQAGKLSADR